jgi:hypothetical protein
MMSFVAPDRRGSRSELAAVRVAESPLFTVLAQRPAPAKPPLLWRCVRR